MPGHLLVFTGALLNILTQHLTTPAVAPFHCVSRQRPRVGVSPRTSFVVFLEPPYGDPEEDVYTYRHGRVEYLRSMEEFQADIFDRYDEPDGSVTFSALSFSTEDQSADNNDDPHVDL